MIRYDISQVIRRVYELAGDKKVKDRTLALLATEEDAKYRRKYAGLWKDT